MSVINFHRLLIVYLNLMHDLKVWLFKVCLTMQTCHLFYQIQYWVVPYSSTEVSV